VPEPNDLSWIDAEGTRISVVLELPGKRRYVSRQLSELIETQAETRSRFETLTRCAPLDTPSLAGEIERDGARPDDFDWITALIS